MKVIFFAAAFALAGTTVAAGTFVCTIKARSGGFVPSIFAIDMPDDGTAAVTDNFIAGLEGKPKILKSKVTSKGEVEARWTLTVPTSVGDKRVRFRALLY